MTESLLKWITDPIHAHGVIGTIPGPIGAQSDTHVATPEIPTSTAGIIRAARLAGRIVGTGITDTGITATTTAAAVGIINATIVPTDLIAGTLVVIETTLDPGAAPIDAAFTLGTAPIVSALPLVLVLTPALEALLAIRTVPIVVTSAGIGVENTATIAADLIGRALVVVATLPVIGDAATIPTDLPLRALVVPVTLARDFVDTTTIDTHLSFFASCVVLTAHRALVHTAAFLTNLIREARRPLTAALNHGRQALAILANQIPLAIVVVGTAALVHVDTVAALADEALITEDLSAGVIADTVAVHAALTLRADHVPAGRIHSINTNVRIAALLSWTVGIAFTGLNTTPLTAEALIAALAGFAITLPATGA